ncbi:MAG: hypothetical protein ETSY2_51100 [Candidatus Entotheonella gemina]|uniref:Uncharacterized protein n=1 Tax=Candidatus Entotheonella gemina TaxID=1429439 RepID=W4L8D8_9BACT|nr:MAG: hypothetical protein ETSY2_51100 [Candidatus Entotheonella gemina]
MPLGVKRMDIHAERNTWAFASVDRHSGIAENKTPNDIRASGDRLQRNGFNVLTHPVVVRLHQHGASRQDRA